LPKPKVKVRLPNRHLITRDRFAGQLTAMRAGVTTIIHEGIASPDIQYAE
jgi:hypothetical protein